MFERAFVINLPFKTDRLSEFQKNYPACLPPCEVWPAVHGDSVRHPDWWCSGSGAWGCYRSHLQILEYCYQRNIESYIVFEDDAIFRPDFEDRLREFTESLPDDWEQVYLGGQLLHTDRYPTRKINDHVFYPRNVNRTHCFAVHRRGFERLYKWLNKVPFAQNDHIDHHLGRLHDSGELKLYVPSKWLVGQDSGNSNINGKYNAANFWINPDLTASTAVRATGLTVQTVFLESTIELAKDLERRGWHRGHWQNGQGLDNGVCNAIVGMNLKSDLVAWQKCVIPEAVREGRVCVCLFHPSLTWDVVQSAGLKDIIRIQANSVDDAERQLSEASTASQPIVQPLRNLIYHIWPKKGDAWKWNVDQLLRRINQFDGVRSIAVVTDDSSDALEDVKAAFSGHRIDNWINFTNDPSRGETVTFEKLLETIPHDGESVTFYGHAKGVTHEGNTNIRSWAAIMYEVCLDNPSFVGASLEQYPVTGPFKNTREYPQMMKHGWHYSGTFYWFRNADLFARDWRNIPPDYYGTEKYLGNLFTDAEAGCLFGGHVGWLYRAWEVERVSGMLNAWRKMAVPVKASETIPVYINAFNLLTPLKKMVEYLQQIPNARTIIVDNDSTWPPLLEWYDNECSVEVIRTGVNGGKFGWAKHLLDHKSLGIEKYVVTDSDLILDGIPLDLLDRLSHGLDINPGVSKVGLSLDIEKIPEGYPLRHQVIEWESQYWRHRTDGFCHAGIDTTFSMRRSQDPIAYETDGHRRADRPYCCEHWPWGWTKEAIESSDEIRHYLANCKIEGLHWTPQITSSH